MKCPMMIKEAKIRQFAKLVFSPKQTGKLKNNIMRTWNRGTLLNRVGLYRKANKYRDLLYKQRQALQKAYVGRTLLGVGGVVGIGSLALKKKKKK